MVEGSENIVTYGEVLLAYLSIYVLDFYLFSYKTMKHTWNSSSVTPNPPPSKVTSRNTHAKKYKAAILSHC